MRHLGFKIFTIALFTILPLSADEAPTKPQQAVAVETVVPEKPQKPPSFIELPPEEPVERVPEILEAKYEATFMKMIATIFLMIVSAGFIVWLYRRFNFTKMHQLNYLRSIKVIEKRPLSPKTMLYLVEINGKQLMLAESQLEVRSVMEFPETAGMLQTTVPEI